MNAISLPQSAAAAILAGQAPVRHLAWRTDHRGPLLIHAAKSERGKYAGVPTPGSACNAVIGVVELADCVQETHPGADPDEGGYYWVLVNPRVFVKPLPVSGRVGLFQVSDRVVVAELARAAAPRRRKKRTRARARK